MELKDNFLMDDFFYMRRAIELAKLGQGFTNPNPLVGCVIVKNGKIIGEGFHKKYGEDHAEVNALKNCIENPKDSTMYVTLEPCSHHGKRPPCCEALVKSGIKRVIIAMKDPNPIVCGNGISHLKRHRVDVKIGLLEESAKNINKIFINYMLNKKPFIRIKSAMTTCGHIATKNNDSKWISNEESRKRVHKDRKKFMSIITGVGTIIKDNPMLNCRSLNPKNPVRIILDSHLRIPLDSNIIKTSRDIKTIVFYGDDKGNTIKDFSEKLKILKNNGVKTYKVPSKVYDDGSVHVNLNEISNKIYELGIDSSYVECGGNLAYNFLMEGLVNEYEVYLSPKIVGGNTALSPITGMGIEKIKDSINLKLIETEILNNDLRILYEVKNVHRVN